MRSLHRGFTLIEMLVTVAIVVALAGVVVPVLSIRRLEDQRHHVDRDLAALAGGIRDYLARTKTFPTGPEGRTTYHFLHTDGRLPANNVFDSGPSAPVAAFFEPHVGMDPWGNAYLVNVNGFFSSVERVLVVSAGPNRQINTAPSATIAGGDDVVLVME